MILYYSKLSNYCSKVKFLIDFKKINVKLVSPPGGYGSNEFKKKSPLGTIPALEHNNIILSESEVINEYLNDTFPDPPLLTKDIKLNAKIRMISRFHDFKLEPAIRFFFKFKKGISFSNMEINQGFENLQKNVFILEDIISDSKYIAMDEISLADFAFPSWFALLKIFSSHFKKKIILKKKTNNYYKNLLNNELMLLHYNSYYQNVLKWSKETLLEL